MIHDLNKPVPEELKGKYDLLFDSGSLEHIFNVPTVLQNYVHLIRKDGILVLDLPVDGCSGHGFFQFSPELVYRYFTAETGCRVEALFCVENLPGSKWYRIPDPTRINRRVEIESSLPIHLLAVVRRVEELDSVSEHFPSQADYEIAWDRGKSGQIETGHDGGKVHLPRFGDLLKKCLRKIFGVKYDRFSIRRDSKRQRRDFHLHKSPLLVPFDPFSDKFEEV